MRGIALGVLSTLLLAAVPARAQLVPRDGRNPIAVRSHRVEALVEDGLARTKVRQTFVNPYGSSLEAIYCFPLPEGAALVDVAMEVGGQRLEGLLAERKRARAVYDDIVRQRRDPALVEQVGRNLFRLSVFPVVPDQPTVVELTWVQRVPLVDGAFRYVCPLGLDGGGAATERDLTVTVCMRSAVPFTNVHASREDVQLVRRSDHEVIASLERSGAALDHDLVVTGEVATAQADLAVKTRCETAGDDGWFQVVITPPQARPDQLVPRDVILVLDTSGSMEGEKLEQAKASALWLLEHLRPADRVNVLRFSSDVQAFAPEPVAATPENLERLTAFVEAFSALGSTALGDALQAASDVPVVEGRARTVVLLTDGRPTVGEQHPVKLVGLAQVVGEKGLHLYPFGVGNDVDGALLQGMAAAGKGSAELFRPGGEIVTRLTSFLTRTASPVLTDLRLEIEGVQVTDVYPRPLPDVYLGEQVTISGRYTTPGTGEVRVSAVLGDARRELRETVDFPAEPGGSTTVAQLYAREKLAWLEAQRCLRLGLADDAYYAALGRGAYSTSDEIVQEMIAVSLGHGVQCAYTSFLVLLPEDRSRLDPRDPVAMAAALDRAREVVGRQARAVEAKKPSADPFAEEPAEPEEILEDADVEEPVMRDVHAGAQWGVADDPADSPFGDDAFNDVIGIGGGAGGKFGGRFGGRRTLRAQGGRGVEQSLVAALEWLASHQSPDGSWDTDGFMNDNALGRSCTCDGAAEADHDVGMTGLALLAFLGDGNTTRQGPYVEPVARGINWLREQQEDSGLLGSPSSPDFLHDHAVATVAMCEAYYFSKNPLLKRTAQDAVDYLVRASGLADGRASDLLPVERRGALLGWTLLALRSAEEGGLTVDRRAYSEALSLLDAIVEPSVVANSMSPQIERETAAAAALLGRFFAGEDPDKILVMQEHAAVLTAHLPAWSADGQGCDQETWCLGLYAMYQYGGKAWEAWSNAVKTAVAGSQRAEGDPRGSWDPVGPWGRANGRVGSTAAMTLCLEVYFRYTKVVGTR